MSLTMLALPGLLLFVLAMIAVMVTDAVHQKIPNKLQLALLAGFVLMAMATGMDWVQLGYHILAAVVVLVFGFSLFALGVMGAGDSKLMAITTLWLGPFLSGTYMLYVGALGGVLCLLVIFSRPILMYSPLARFRFLNDWVTRKDRYVPYGVALGTAALMVLPQMPLYEIAMAQI